MLLLVAALVVAAVVAMCMCWCMFGCARGKKEDGDDVTQTRAKDYFETVDTEDVSYMDMCSDILKTPSQFLGELTFSVLYDETGATLKVQVTEAQSLPDCDEQTTCDPYVKVTLLPDRGQQFRTKVIKNRFSPRWLETFSFKGLSKEKMRKQVLQLCVYDYDIITRDDPIGAVLLPLCEYDFKEWRVFTEPLKLAAQDCGDLQTALRWNGSTLTVLITKAAHLRIQGFNLKLDPYVLVSVKHGSKTIKKYQTKTMRNTSSPQFKETFIFGLEQDQLSEHTLFIEVMDSSFIGKGRIIGRLVLSEHCATGVSEKNQWHEMVTSPGQSIVRWHRLKEELRINGRKVV
ncbi:synaptotagmin-7-like [Periplaneta americana]|uniref:synaptotagmin-7-like n=1 Tax=Periplaneta americana TaxID=6978 RepID=UPI0037E81F03